MILFTPDRLLNLLLGIVTKHQKTIKKIKS